MSNSRPEATDSSDVRETLEPSKSTGSFAEASLEKTFVQSGTGGIGSSLEATRLGRYQILEKLGQGGMGAVYRAADSVTGEDVAIKVLADGCLSQPDALRRFEKEARLLEAAKSPYVANLLDVGIEGDTRYLVMEFVRGGDLRGMLKKRGAFDESIALEIIGDLCRALVTAHAKGLVHRDIKPENVLLDDAEDSHRPSIKLTDFGLARHVDQSDSLKLTQTGALLGTPYYMSPEQFTGVHEVSPATDIYSIGATFFELLTGDRPFPSTDAMKLATAHCFESPPDVRQRNQMISDATAALVNRMLAKHPGQRPPDASAVLEEIIRLQTGDASQFVVHPVLTKSDPAGILFAEYEWDLASSPAALCPFVSNTDRFNRAAGFQPMDYETISEPDGRVRKFGQFNMFGMHLRWEEHPFEWIEGNRFSVLREFPTGPFVWFMSNVELVPLANGGTRLTHRVKIEPRGMVGRMLAKLELGPKTRRKFDRIYNRIDKVLRGTNSASRVDDPFHAVPGLNRMRMTRLERGLDQLVDAGVSDQIVETIREIVMNASEQDLARLRPVALARRFGLPERDVIDAFLRAVTVGLMTLHWDLICPTCRLAADTRSTLREIERHADCSACRIKFDVEFGSSLELIFRVHPEIRSCDSRTYCAGGPGNFPHVVAQVRLSSAERLVLPLSLNAGSYVMRGPTLPYAIPIEVDSQHGLRHGSIQCAVHGNRSPVPTLKVGHQSLAVENLFPMEQVLRIERTVRRTETLTATDVSTMPLFRSLFPDQTLSPGMLVEVASANFLAVRLNGLDEAFNEFGDAKTYTQVRDFWKFAERLIIRIGGAVIDHDVELVLASFSDPVMAIDAAGQFKAMLTKELPEWSWSVSAGIHRGTALVTGDQNETRYFGSAISRTTNLARRASPDIAIMTREIWSDPEVAIRFADQLIHVLTEEDADCRLLLL